MSRPADQVEAVEPVVPLEDGLKPTIAWIRDAVVADPDRSR